MLIALAIFFRGGTGAKRKNYDGHDGYSKQNPFHTFLN
jgi:hypothetical protein